MDQISLFSGIETNPNGISLVRGALLTDSALPPAAPTAGALDIQNLRKGEP
jgi:hypothetical protein